MFSFGFSFRQPRWCAVAVHQALAVPARAPPFDLANCTAPSDRNVWRHMAPHAVAERIAATSACTRSIRKGCAGSHTGRLLGNPLRGRPPAASNRARARFLRRRISVASRGHCPARGARVIARRHPNSTERHHGRRRGRGTDCAQRRRCPRASTHARGETPSARCGAATPTPRPSWRYPARAAIRVAVPTMRQPAGWFPLYPAPADSMRQVRPPALGAGQSRKLPKFPAIPIAKGAARVAPATPGSSVPSRLASCLGGGPWGVSAGIREARASSST